MALPKISLNDGKHKMIVAEEGERVLTPEQNKAYEVEHPDARKKPMMANVYDKGGDLPANSPNRMQQMSQQAAALQQPVASPTASRKPTHFADAALADAATPVELGAPMSQEAFDKGGDVQSAPAETSTWDKIKNRAQEIYEAGKQKAGDLMKYPQASANPEMGQISGKMKMAEDLKRQGEAQAGTLPEQVAPPASTPPVGSDKINPMAKYGDKPGEVRPEKMAPLYDEGGSVQKNDQENAADEAAKKDAALEQATHEMEQKMDGGKGAPADFPGRVLPNPKGVEVKSDTEPLGKPADTPTEPMNMGVYKGGNEMNMSNSPKNEWEGGPVQEASTIPQRGPQKMIQAPQAASTTPEAPPATPDPMAIIQKDKMTAMKKGTAGLADLGTSLIHERLMKDGTTSPELAGEPTMADVSAAPKGAKTPAEDWRMTQEKVLHDKMLGKGGESEQERFQAEKDLAELKRKTPWGSAENHPGIMGKIGHVASAIGQAAGQATVPYVMQAIPGSKLDIQRSEQLGEQGVEAAQGKELKAAQIASAKAAPELAEQKIEVMQQKHAADMLKAGFKYDALTGEFDTPVPYEEMTAPQQALYDKNESFKTLNESKAGEQQAKAALEKYKADPNNAQNQAALAKVLLEGKKVAIAAGNLGIHEKEFLRDTYGVDEKGNAIPGVETTSEGKPIGTKVGKGGAGGPLQVKGVQARNVQDNLNAAIDLIQDNPDLFGKVAGRYTSTRDMIGTDDVAIDRLGNLIHNAALASTSVHGLRGEKAVEATEKELLNHFKNSPEATIAGMQDTINSMQTFTDAATKGAKATINAPNKPKGAATATPAPAGATNEVTKDGKVIGHVVVDAATGKKKFVATAAVK